MRSLFALLLAFLSCGSLADISKFENERISKAKHSDMLIANEKGIQFGLKEFVDGEKKYSLDNLEFLEQLLDDKKVLGKNNPDKLIYVLFTPCARASYEDVCEKIAKSLFALGIEKIRFYRITSFGDGMYFLGEMQKYSDQTCLDRDNYKLKIDISN